MLSFLLHNHWKSSIICWMKTTQRSGRLSSELCKQGSKVMPAWSILDSPDDPDSLGLFTVLPAYSCSRVNFIHTYLALSQSCSLWSLVLGYFLSPMTCESPSSILSCKSWHSLSPSKSCQVQSLHLPTNLAKWTFATQISVIWFIVQINEIYRYLCISYLQNSILTNGEKKYPI